MVAYSWEKCGRKSNQIQPTYAAFFNSYSSTTFGYISTKINRANPRKEFFRTELNTIKAIVTAYGGEIEFKTDVVNAVAQEYYDSLKMSAEDQQFVESVHSALEEDGELVGEDA